MEDWNKMSNGAGFYYVNGVLMHDLVSRTFTPPPPPLPPQQPARSVDEVLGKAPAQEDRGEFSEWLDALLSASEELRRYGAPGHPCLKKDWSCRKLCLWLVSLAVAVAIALGLSWQ